MIIIKILVIMTGGTIGSTVKDGWISTDDSVKYLLIKQYKENFSDDTIFDVREPYCLLSENLSSEQLNLLTASIENALKESFDGIIVTHGTDSLHFSAAAAHLAFGNAGTPIVFVSSNYPLESPSSNGFVNFEAAVSLIKSGVKSGVYISYKNPNGQHYIHTADHALSFNESDDSIYPLIGKPFAIFKNGKTEVFEEYTSSYTNKTVFCKEPKILTITSSPSDSFSYNPGDFNAVILRPYHSGTINTENDRLKAFLKNAEKSGVPVFLVNAPAGVTYETAKVYDELGLIPLPLTTFPYVYMKLWAGISEGKNLKILF